jgi:hypothetical protein
LAGGVALEVHLGEAWRPHGDIDIALRSGTPTLSALARDDHQSPVWRAEFIEWIQETARGLLVPFAFASMPEGPTIEIRAVAAPRLGWSWSRRPDISVLWRNAVLRTAAGLPYLAPELVMLMKSVRRIRRDDVDAQYVLPKLNEARRLRLRSWLPLDHPWLNL